MVAVHFVFGLAYSPKSANCLEFLQQYLFQINIEESKKSGKNMKTSKMVKLLKAF